MTDVPTPSREGPVVRAVDIIFTVSLVAFSVFFIWQSTLISDPPRSISIGPRTFPFMVGGLMLGVTLLLAWQRLRFYFAKPGAPVVAEQDDAVVPLEDDEVAVNDWPAVWVTLGALLALFMTIETLGFVTSFVLFMFGLSTFFAPRRWLANLIVAVAFSLIFYLLFTRVLEVPLPNGILESLF